MTDDASFGGNAADREPGTGATVPHDMGEPSLNLDKALQLAGDLEDAEICRTLKAAPDLGKEP